jgi:uncharacterized glyoxalase superfamily protein PhnB
MAVIVIQEFEGTREEYDAVNEKIDPENNPPSGLIVHAGADIGGGKLRVVDIWESEGDFQSFLQERLVPAIAEVNPDAPQADVQMHEAIDLVKG